MLLIDEDFTRLLASSGAWILGDVQSSNDGPVVNIEIQFAIML